MEQSLSWQANRFYVGKEIRRILRKRFITVVTSARHLSLSWASSIQSIPPHSTSCSSILILSSHLRLGLPSGFFTSGFPHQDSVYASPLAHTSYMLRPSHYSDFIIQTILGEEYSIFVPNILQNRFAICMIFLKNNHNIIGGYNFTYTE